MYLVVTPTILAPRSIDRIDHINEMVRRHTGRKSADVFNAELFDIIKVLTHVDDFEKTHKRLRKLVDDIRTNNMLLGI